jgi:hypothetical protein
VWTGTPERAADEIQQRRVDSRGAERRETQNLRQTSSPAAKPDSTAT